MLIRVLAGLFLVGLLGSATKAAEQAKPVPVDPLPLPVAPTIFEAVNYQPPWPYWWWGAYLYVSGPVDGSWGWPAGMPAYMATGVRVTPPLPPDAAALYQRGYRLYLAGQSAEAVKALTDAVKMVKDDPRYWLFKGLAEKAAGNQAAAAASIRTGLTLQPGRLDLVRLGLAWERVPAGDRDFIRDIQNKLP